jgi:hypothetical protein
VKVALDDLRSTFDDLVAGSRSRESIADFATEAMKANDLRELVFEPAAAEDKIWDAILYLLVVDLRDSPSTYLHSVEDFLEYRAKAGI